MSILLDEDTKVIVQGITGKMARFHTKDMLEYGTKVVGGVVPGKSGDSVEGIPVFDTVKEAVAATGAEASLVFVPPPFAADSIMEAADGGIRYCVCITDGIPAQDMIAVKRYMMRYPQEKRMVLTGPNCAGTISPGKALLGIMPSNIYLKGSSFKDILMRFEEDDDTDVIAMIGEIGGPQEAEAAEFIKENVSKPVVAYVAGLTAPTGRTMGHAGAIISAFGESASEKVEILSAAGVTVAENPAVIGDTIASVLERSS